MSFPKPSLAALLAAAGMLLLPPTADAQERTSPQLQSALMEYDQVQEELNAIRAEALERNPALNEQQNEIQERVEQMMLEAYPELKESVDYQSELKVQMQRAGAAGRQEEVDRLMQESQRVQLQIRSVQSEVMESDAIAAELSAYRENLLEEMSAVDPTAPRLIERLEQLADQLRTSLPGS